MSMYSTRANNYVLMRVQKMNVFSSVTLVAFKRQLWASIVISLVTRVVERAKRAKAAKNNGKHDNIVFCN